jgi:hypothetical protein
LAWLKSTPEAGRLARLGRLAPSLIAVYELRYLLASAGAALAGTEHAYPHSIRTWVIALVALATGTLLLEIGRGLPAHVGRPPRSLRLVGLWLLCFSTLVALVGCQVLVSGLLHGGHSAGLVTMFGTGTWSSICSAAGVGLVLAASLGGACWVLQKVARWRRVEVALRRPDLAIRRVSSIVMAPTPVPLMAGWSDRGPPASALLAAVAI